MFKRNRKRYLATTLVMLSLLALTGCNGEKNEENKTSNTTITTFDGTIAGEIPTIQEMELLLQFTGLPNIQTTPASTAVLLDDGSAFKYYSIGTTEEAVKMFDEYTEIFTGMTEEHQKSGIGDHKCYFVIGTTESEDGSRMFKYFTEEHDAECNKNLECDYTYSVGYMWQKDGYFIDYYYVVTADNVRSEGIDRVEGILEDYGILSFPDDDVTVINDEEEVTKEVTEKAEEEATEEVAEEATEEAIKVDEEATEEVEEAEKP